MMRLVLSVVASAVITPLLYVGIVYGLDGGDGLQAIYHTRAAWGPTLMSAGPYLFGCFAVLAGVIYIVGGWIFPRRHKPAGFAVYEKVMPRRAGFTLLELLVVVGVLAILASVLLPVVAGVRRQSYLVTCTNNLHALGQAVRQYAQDSGGYLPQGVAWQSTLARYVGDSPGVCPAIERETGNGSYTYNAMRFAPPYGDAMSVWGKRLNTVYTMYDQTGGLQGEIHFPASADPVDASVRISGQGVCLDGSVRPYTHLNDGSGGAWTDGDSLTVRTAVPPY